METLDRTDKALLQKEDDEYCVVTWTRIGMRRNEKWFDDILNARIYFEKVK